MVLRLTFIAFQAGCFLVRVAFGSVIGRTLSFRLAIANEAARFCEHLGGAFPKIGQILSTRADYLPDPVRLPLCRLQDHCTALRAEVVKSILFRSTYAGAFRTVNLEPVASATVAQVHEATRADDGRVVALKIMRPSIRREIWTDCQLIQCFGRFVAQLPAFASIPINETLIQASHVLIRQTDFKIEAQNHRRLQSIFADNEEILVPKLHEDLCTDNVLVTEFVFGTRKLTETTLPDEIACKALLRGVRALYKMIFEEGFIHCDMHPGNALVAPDGRLVILDAGFMVELSEDTRRAFAKFFLAIAFRDGKTASRIVRETALRLPPGLNVESFDHDVAELIARFGGLRARHFQVAGFVGELFAIMRKHRIYGPSEFTLIILSLLVYEGVTKQRYPDLDFQEEAKSFVMSALSKR